MLLCHALPAHLQLPRWPHSPRLLLLKLPWSMQGPPDIGDRHPRQEWVRNVPLGVEFLERFVPMDRRSRLHIPLGICFLERSNGASHRVEDFLFDGMFEKTPLVSAEWIVRCISVTASSLTLPALFP